MGLVDAIMSVVSVYYSGQYSVHWGLHKSTAPNATASDINFLLYCAGNSTHPQIILDEVSFTLRGLAKLVLHPLTATHINLPVRRTESRAEQNQHEQESRLSSSSTFHNVKLQSLQGSERAHLFLLYRNFCELLTIRYDLRSFFWIDMDDSFWSTGFSNHPTGEHRPVAHVKKLWNEWSNLQVVTLMVKFYRGFWFDLVLIYQFLCSCMAGYWKLGGSFKLCFCLLVQSWACR